jgi:SNF family Na+-dependent transporter
VAGSLLVCYAIIIKGIKVSGKVTLVTVLGPYIFLLIFLFRNLSLSGSWSGIKHMLTPHLSQVLNPSVWQGALSQNLFQNSLGFGTILTFASFRDKRFHLKKSTRILIWVNFGTGVITTLIMFGYVGHLSLISQTPIEDFPLSGPSLLFVTFPAALASFPLPRLWLSLFFFTIILLGIDSQIALLETISDFLKDISSTSMLREPLVGPNKEHGKYRLWSCVFVFVCGVCFSTPIGFSLISFLNRFCTMLPTSITLILDIYVFYFKDDFYKLTDQLRKQTGEIFSNFSHFSLKFIAFLLIFAVLCSWFWQIPSIASGQSFSFLTVGTLTNMILIFPIIYNYFKYK